MRARGVVVIPPAPDLVAGVLQGPEPVQVEAFVPEPAVEGLDVGVLDGLAWLDEAQADAGALRPFEHRPAGAFGSIVEDDLLRQAELEGEFVEEPGYSSADYLCRWQSRSASDTIRLRFCSTNSTATPASRFSARMLTKPRAALRVVPPIRADLGDNDSGAPASLPGGEAQAWRAI